MDGPTVLNFELHVPKRKREPRLVIFSKGLMKENVEKRTGKPFEQRVIDFKAELNNAFDAGAVTSKRIERGSCGWSQINGIEKSFPDLM